MSRRLLRAVAVAAGTAAILFVGAQGVARVWHMTDEVARLEKEIGALRAETDEMSATAARLRTSAEAIEELARDGLGMARPGERIYKLPPSRAGR